MNDSDVTPWSVKQLALCLYGSLEDKWLTFEIWPSGELNVYEGDGSKNPRRETGGFFFEEIPLDAVKQLRDFLNYALKDE